MSDTNLTSVKLIKSMYQQFKAKTVNTKMSLQKLTNRSMYMYLFDDSFKDKIESNNDLVQSGSNF